MFGPQSTPTPNNCAYVTSSALGPLQGVYHATPHCTDGGGEGVAFGRSRAAVRRGSRLFPSLPTQVRSEVWCSSQLSFLNLLPDLLLAVTAVCCGGVGGMQTGSRYLLVPHRRSVNAGHDGSSPAAAAVALSSARMDRSPGEMTSCPSAGWPVPR